MSRFKLLTGSLVLALLTVQACTKRSENDTVISDATPPARYQTLRPFTVVPKAATELALFCQAYTKRIMPAGRIYGGCSEVGTPVAYLGDPCAFPSEIYAHRMCHELGHINGWPQTHPGS